MPESILILHCNMIKQASVLQRNGFVLIENGKISQTGSMRDPVPNGADIEIDGTNKLLIPGLINGHNHSPMTLFRGMADDLGLSNWLHDHIFPAEAASVTEEMVYWCSKLAAAEMLLSGTTCVADGYFYSDQTASAFVDAGIRGVVAHGIVDFPAPGVPDPKSNIETVKLFIQRWQNKSALITPAVFAHSAYTCSPETLVKAKQLADDNQVRFFIHLAESKNEQQSILSPAGNSPIKHLNNLGILDTNSVLVHSIWLDDQDLDILTSSGAHVILCPQSNFKLASGKSPAVKFSKNGVKLGLGTDSCASNNSMDMFREMDLFAKSQKAFSLDPTLFPAKEVFQAATMNTNEIIGYTSPVNITPGSRADLVLIDLEAPHLTPFYNQDLLVYSVRGSDVDSVLVNGRLVVKNKTLQTIDLKKTQRKVEDLAEPLQQMYGTNPNIP